MNQFPYFPLYVNDLLNDEKVAVMTAPEFGAYLLLLCQSWHQVPVASLPDDSVLLARWARMSEKEWDRVKVRVLACFKISKKDKRLHQKRLRFVYKSIVENNQKKSESGRKAANAKHSKDRQSRADAVRTHVQTHAITDTDSDTDLNTNNSNPADAGLLELRVELAMWGVEEPTLTHLARRLNAINAIPLDVRMAHIETARAKKGPGWLITKLRGGIPPLSLTAKSVIELVEGNHVVRINGHPVAPGWVRKDPRENLCIFGRRCANVDPYQLPDPVEVIGAGDIEADMLTLSGHEQTETANAA